MGKFAEANAHFFISPATKYQPKITGQIDDLFIDGALIQMIELHLRRQFPAERIPDAFSAARALVESARAEGRRIRESARGDVEGDRAALCEELRAELVRDTLRGEELYAIVLKLISDDISFAVESICSEVLGEVLDGSLIVRRVQKVLERLKPFRGVLRVHPEDLPHAAPLLSGIELCGDSTVGRGRCSFQSGLASVQISPTCHLDALLEVFRQNLSHWTEHAARSLPNLFDHDPR